MKDIVLCLMLLLIFIVVGLRIHIQVSSIKVLKESGILKKLELIIYYFSFQKLSP